MAEPARPRAHDIYKRVSEDAADELERSPGSLAYSGLFAGFTIGASPLALVLVLSAVDGDGRELIAALLYPIGYVAVILGRAQFFTENTLYPVMLTFEDRSALGPTARLWAIILATNLTGALLFTLLATQTGAIEVDVRDELTSLGTEDVAAGFGAVFWGAVLVGWILALVAWLVEATETAIGQFAVIWSLILLIGLGSFDHCIGSTIEVAAATFEGAVDVDRLFGWLATVTLGNIAGGVFIVSVLNYGQARHK